MASAPTNRLIGLMARLRGRAIDDDLLAGKPADGVVRRARLARLLDRRYRATLAESLRKVVTAARRRHPNPFVAEIPLQVREVLDTEPLILTLALELEEEEAVSARGVILADRLVRDGDSPVYWRSDVKVNPDVHEESVEDAVKHARAALLLN